MIFRGILRNCHRFQQCTKTYGFSTGQNKSQNNKQTPNNKVKQSHPSTPHSQLQRNKSSPSQKTATQNDVSNNPQLKQADFQISNLYKQILEQERDRMGKNQQKIQEMLAKQRQRSDKKQEFMKSLQTLIGVGGLMGLIYYIFTVVNAGGDAFQKVKKYWDQAYTKYELVEKYSQNKQKLPSYYLQGNLIQKQLSKIEFDGIIGMTFLVGIPGSGKTTALKKVINNLREKIGTGESRWEKIYYINLRVDDENGRILLEKTKQRIDEMSKLLKSIFSAERNYKDALIVIDDIQMIERVLTEEETKQIMQSILFKCEMQSCKFVVVSSSSLSYYRALKSIRYKKSAFMSEIQNMSSQNLRQAIQKRVEYEKQVNGIQISEKIVSFLGEYDSIKGIMNTINLVTNEYRLQKWLKSKPLQQLKLIQKIKEADGNKIWDMKISITKLLRDKSHIIHNKALAEIIRCMLQLPVQVKISDKFVVISKVVKKYPELRNYLDEISNVIDELDKNNILIFAHPRTKLQRKALEEVLEGIK